MSIHSRLRNYVDMLSTSILGPLLPDFIEDYGENKNLDVKIYFSKSKFLEEFPNTKPTSITFDKNGLCKV
jgi:hypothetical protein